MRSDARSRRLADEQQYLPTAKPRPELPSKVYGTLGGGGKGFRPVRRWERVARSQDQHSIYTSALFLGSSGDGDCVLWARDPNFSSYGELSREKSWRWYLPLLEGSETVYVGSKDAFLPVSYERFRLTGHDLWWAKRPDDMWPTCAAVTLTREEPPTVEDYVGYIALPSYEGFWKRTACTWTPTSLHILRTVFRDLRPAFRCS